MASFLEQSSISDSSHFRTRLGPALAKVANAVRNEDTTGQGDSYKAKRQGLAVACRLQLEAVVTPAARLVAENPSIQGNCTFTTRGDGFVDADTSAVPDGDIEYTISQQWDVLAGVLKSEEPTP